MRALLEQLIHRLVEHPEEVRLTEIDGQRTTLYELRCNKSDVGKVIGKQGKTVASLRSILSAIAARTGKRAVFEVVD